MYFTTKERINDELAWNRLVINGSFVPYDPDGKTEVKPPDDKTTDDKKTKKKTKKKVEDEETEDTEDSEKEQLIEALSKKWNKQLNG